MTNNLYHNAIEQSVTKNGFNIPKEPPSISSNINAESNQNQPLAADRADSCPAKMPQKISKPPLIYVQSDLIMLIICLILGYLAIKFVLATELGIATSIYIIAVIGLFFYWLIKNKFEFSKLSWPYLAFIFSGAVYCLVFDNWLFKILFLTITAILIPYLLLIAQNARLENKLGDYFIFDIIKGLIKTPFSHYSAAGNLLYQHSKNSQNWRGIMIIGLGLLIAAPITLIILNLLLSADQAFNNLWHYISDSFFNQIFTNIWQFIAALPFSFYLFALFFNSQKPLKADDEIIKANARQQKLKSLPSLALIGAITPILLIYILFFIAQSAYYLAAFQGLVPDGYSHATYAREGFFQLCNVSAINLALIIISLVFAKNKSRILKIYHFSLAFSSMVLIVISLRKMFLYIGEYGLTSLRVYTSWFMLFLFVVFILLIIRLIYNRLSIFKFTVIIGLAMFMILSFSQPNQLIANYNVANYLNGNLEDIDIYHLDSLGDNAIPALIKIAKLDHNHSAYHADLSNIANIILSEKARHYEGREYSWTDFNFSSYFNRQLLANW